MYIGQGMFTAHHIQKVLSAAQALTIMACQVSAPTNLHKVDNWAKLYDIRGCCTNIKCICKDSQVQSLTTSLVSALTITQSIPVKTDRYNDL